MASTFQPLITTEPEYVLKTCVRGGEGVTAKDWEREERCGSVSNRALALAAIRTHTGPKRNGTMGDLAGGLSDIVVWR